MPGIHDVLVMLGPSDLFVQARLTGGDESVIELQIGRVRGEGATFMETNLVLRHDAHRLDVTALPVIEPALSELPAPTVTVDDLDTRLYGELAVDGRRSGREIARLLDTAERIVRGRIRRLQDSGLIRIVTMVDRWSDYE